MLTNSRQGHHFVAEVCKVGILVDDGHRDSGQPAGLELTQLRQHGAIGDSDGVSHEETRPVVLKDVLEVAEESPHVSSLLHEAAPQLILDLLALLSRQVLVVAILVRGHIRRGRRRKHLLTRCGRMSM